MIAINKFDEPVTPKLPSMRVLAEEETMFLFANFNNFGWSNPDRNGRVILNGGECARGLYWIAIEEL